MAEEIKNTVAEPSDAVTFDEEFDKNNFDVIEPNEYEVKLEKTEKRTSKDGTKTFISCTFRIRSDVDQKFKNRIVWDTIFQDKTNSKWFDLLKLNKIVKTQVKRNPDGSQMVGADGKPVYEKLGFKTCDECLCYINGLNMRVFIDKEFDDAKGEDRNVVKYLSYKPSQSGVKEAAEAVADDLPF